MDNNQSSKPNPPPLTIVGVVPRTRNEAPGEENIEKLNFPQMYFCAAQMPQEDVVLMVRVASGDPLALAAAIKREVQAIDPDQPVASKPDRRLQRSTWTDHEWTPIDTNWGLGLTRESGGNQGAALSKPPSKITLRLQSPLKRLRSALIERRLESP